MGNVNEERAADRLADNGFATPDDQDKSHTGSSHGVRSVESEAECAGNLIMKNTA
jgi:hypothetical protein